MDKHAKPLGKGTFGTVYLARVKSNGSKAAVKIIEKGKLQQMKVPVTIVGTECEMMRECAGKEGFVQLYDVIESTSRFCLILEFCDGGNLQDGAMSREGQLGEAHVRMLMHQMIESITFLHSRNICHRDIKPHNYLVVGNIASSSVKIKLGDFGTAMRLERGKLCKEQVGTPAFMAPEIHLLPDKSSGYDHKVDVWAVGVCMIFLLANEYPFIDGKGKLLRHRIIKGDVPLWEGNAFQNLFQGAQELLGMANFKKKPSKTARDLTRHLLAPRRQDRISAHAALQHDWFTRPIVESSPYEVGDNMPLLDMKEFDNAFGLMEQELGRAVVALGRMEIGSMDYHLPPSISPSDERFSNCVVCYHSVGDFKYTCPQCHYSLCTNCLRGLKKPVCPHCRHEATDMVLAQNAAHLARRGSKIFEDATGLIGNVTSLAMDVDVPHSALSSAERARRYSCVFCSKPSQGNNYGCPACSSSVCFDCAKYHLVARPQCPTCGNVEQVAATVPQYIAANEAWNAASEFGGAITKSISDLGRRISGSQVDQQHLASPPPMMSKNFHERASACCLCNTAPSMFDHVCPNCNSCTCATCITTRLPREDLRCPKCHDSSRNAHNMNLIATANQARASLSTFWDSISTSFGNDTHKNVTRIP
jgi:serine/threonine protein kinase